MMYFCTLLPAVLKHLSTGASSVILECKPKYCFKGVLLWCTSLLWERAVNIVFDSEVDNIQSKV